MTLVFLCPSSLSISPTSGTALVDEFELTMSNWVTDSDAYPLTYSFYYVIGCVAALVLATQTPSPLPFEVC